MREVNLTAPIKEEGMSSVRLLSESRNVVICSIEVDQFSSYNISLPMINIFKSRQYRKVYALLQANGMHGEDFKNFHIGQIARKIAQQPTLFASLITILRQAKLTPLRLLKTLMIIQNLLQIDPRMQENASLLQLLQEMTARTRLLLKHSHRQPRSTTLSDSQDQIHSSAEMRGWNDNKEENGPSLFMGRILLPLLQLQERIIYSYELVYHPQTEMEVSGCWATLNLLRKFVEISPDLEEIGRYYFKQYASATICLIKVLDNDIQMLYKRIREFLSHRTSEVQVLLEDDKSQQQREKVEELLQLVEELEDINQILRLLYNGKYFVKHLMANHIFLPSLFTNQNKLDLFYQMRSQYARRDRKWKNNSREIFPSRIKNQKYATQNLEDV